MLTVFRKVLALIKHGPVFIVVLVFGVMAFTNYLILGAIVRESCRINTEQTLALLQAEIESDLEKPKLTLAAFAKIAGDVLLSGGNTEMLDELVIDMAGDADDAYMVVPEYNGLFLYYVSPSGGASFLSSAKQPSQQVPGDDFIPEESSWFLAAAAGGGRIVQTMPKWFGYLSLSWFTYACSLYDEDGSLVGVAGFDVPLNTIVQKITRWGLIKEGYGILLNEEMEIFAHPNDAFMGRALSNTNDGTADLGLSLINGIPVSGAIIKDYMGDKTVVFSGELTNGWHLLLLQLYSRYNQNLRKVLMWLVIQGVILGTVLIVILRFVFVAKNIADARNQQKSNFLATMSHEIRTPLNAILGIAEIQIQNESLSQDIKEELFKIHNSGDLLLGIINDILDFSKIEAGKMELVPTKYEVASLINDVVQLNKLRYEYKPIKMKLEIDERIPSVLIGDELRIKQILNNLLSNSFKYTDRGEILFSVRVIYPAGGVAAHVALVFRVSDTGQGMTEEQIKKLFDEYSRFNMESNRTTAGTGLGMSITQKLVQLMNGTIAVESKPGKGTTVTVQMPQRNVGIGVSGILGKDVVESLEQFRVGSAAQIQKLQITRDPMSYGSVLIVDDVESNLYVAKGLLAPYGLAIETVTSGYEAIEKIKAGKVYDIVFMDHMMPKMDGIETTRIMRSLGYANPIVALTANALAGHAEMFLKNGFDGFISKPIDIRQLNASLNKLIRDKQPHEVIKAAIEKKREQDEQNTLTRNIPKPAVDPELLELFVQDADRVINSLESIIDNEYRRSNDLQLYIINVHGIKSALANINEKDLSAYAYKLEMAGKEKNTEMIREETPVFLEKLKARVDEIKSI